VVVVSLRRLNNNCRARLGLSAEKKKIENPISGTEVTAVQSRGIVPFFRLCAAITSARRGAARRVAHQNARNGGGFPMQFEF